MKPRKNPHTQADGRKSAEQAELNKNRNENPAMGEAKKLIRVGRALVALFIIFGVLLVAVCVLAFVDKATSPIVYLVLITLFLGLEILFCSLLKAFERKINLQGGVVGENLPPKTVDIKSLKDVTYRVLTGIAFFGDAMLIVGVAFLVSQADVPAAVTVIFILLGTLILLVFYISALVYICKRKSKAEKNLHIKGE